MEQVRPAALLDQEFQEFYQTKSSKSSTKGREPIMSDTEQDHRAGPKLGSRTAFTFDRGRPAGA